MHRDPSSETYRLSDDRPYPRVYQLTDVYQCPVCAALVVDIRQHDYWHAEQTNALQVLGNMARGGYGV